MHVCCCTGAVIAVVRFRVTVMCQVRHLAECGDAIALLLAYSRAYILYFKYEIDLPVVAVVQLIAA